MENMYYPTTECRDCQNNSKELMTFAEICKMVNNCPTCNENGMQVEGFEGHLRLWLRNADGTVESELLASLSLSRKH